MIINGELDMDQKVHLGKKEAKIQLIIKESKKVFQKKGFVAVTMQDIVDACKISRGGLYKYFANTSEIFESVLMNFPNDDVEMIQQQIADGVPFIELLDGFLNKQKNELVNLDESLRIATYEFYLKDRSIRDTEMIRANLEGSVSGIKALLEYGQKEGKVKEFRDIDLVAQNFVMWLEGLNLTAIVAALDEDTIEKQLQTIKIMIQKEDENECN